MINPLEVGKENAGLGPFPGQGQALPPRTEDPENASTSVYFPSSLPVAVMEKLPAGQVSHTLWVPPTCW